LVINNLANNVGIGTSTVDEKLDVNGKGRFKGVVVNSSVDGTGAQGVMMWNRTDTNWAIYMGQSGAGKSFSGGTAVAGSGFTQHGIRIRTSAGIEQGIIFENASEQLNLSVRGSDGFTYIRGTVSTPSSVQGLHLPVRHLRAKLNTDVFIASNTYTNILTGQLNILTGRDSIIHINAFIPYQIAGGGADSWESLIQLSTNNSTWNNVAYGYQVWFGGTFGTGSRSGALFPLSGWFIVPATNVSTIYFKVMARRLNSDDGANFYSVGSTSNVHMIQYIW
jgi:hypothetical protein